MWVSGPSKARRDFAVFWLNIASRKRESEECYWQFSAKNLLIPTKWCFNHSTGSQSIGKVYPKFNVFHQKWNIPWAGWPLCKLTFALSPRSSTLHFNSLEIYLALTLSESVMLSGSNVFQTKTNKTKGNQGNLQRLSNYYERKERASKDETISRTGEHCTTSDVLLVNTISCKKTNLWGDRRADFRNTKHSVQNNSNFKIQGHTFPRTPEIPLPWHCSPPLHCLQVPQLLCSSPGANIELRPLCRYTWSFRGEISKELTAWNYLPVHTPEQSLNFSYRQ